MAHNTRLSPDQSAKLEEARTFLAERAVDVDREGRFPKENFSKLADLGILDFALPTEEGGWGAGPAGDIGLFVEVIESLAAACSSTAQGLAVHAYACAAVLLLGNEEQRRWLLEDVRREKGVLGWFGSEPTQRLTSEGHRASYATTAEATPTGWRVNGRKFFATNSPGARWHLLQAVSEVDGDMLVSVPIICVDDPGVTVNDDWDHMGQRGTGSGSVDVRDVEIGPEWMVGSPGAYYRYGLVLYGVFQLGFATLLTGIAAGALEFEKHWLLHEAKAPIGLPSLSHDPHVQRLTGELETWVSASRALLFEAADLLEAGRDAPELRSEAFDAIMRAKVLATEVSLRAGSEVFQICSARSAARRYGADRFWRNARTLSLHDVLDRQRCVVGRRALGIDEGMTVFEAPRSEADLAAEVKV